MVTASRPTRLSIEEEFYSPIPLGKGQRVEYNAGPEAGGLVLLGYILRWGACYYVAGPDFAHTEQQLLTAIKAGRVDVLGQGEAQAARVQRHGSLLEAVAGLCALIDQAYGPEGERPLEGLEYIEEEDVLDPSATPEDPTYAEC